MQQRYVKYIKLYSINIVLAAVAFMFSMALGSVQIPLVEITGLMFGRYTSEVFRSIIFEIRLPRTIATVAGGSSLAVAGLLLQVFFRNAIVEPFVLGISSGATLFVGIVLLTGLTFGFAGINPIFLFITSLIGSLVVMSITIFLAGKLKNIITLLVVGLMIGYVASAATTVLMTFARQEQLRGFVIWTMGSFAGATWEQLSILVVVSVIMLAGAYSLTKPLNAFLLGEDYAQSMGVPIKLFRISIIVISSLLSGVVTAFAGPVAFIGLAVPHIARLIFKTSDNRVILPACVILGATLTILCDLVARLVFAPTELPISAVTSFIGAPIVIFLMLNRKSAI